MTLPDLIKATIRAMWRRRVIMLAPLLIVIPLSIIAALLWPTRYETNALILLQEYGGLTGGVPSYLRAQELKDKVTSLETLVKSEYVIQRTLARHHDEELTKSELEKYRERLTVEQVGNQFVSLSLIGEKSEGLGDELSLVLTTLFESLLTTDTNALNAPRFVVQKHRKALADIEKQLRETASASTTDTLGAITAQQAALTNATAAVSDAEAETERRRGALFDMIRSAGLGIDIDAGAEAAAILSRLEEELKSREESADTAGAEKVRGLIASARSLDETARAGATARQQRATAEAELAKLRRTLEERSELEQQAARLRQRAALFEQRLATAAQPADMQLLSAPAQIQVIDTPKDPRQRLNSRFKIVLAGVFAAFAMAAAFALIAEQLDNRLRGANMLQSLTGLPVVAVFPPGVFSPEASPPASSPAGAEPAT